ncbi:MAG TPA: magnesium transporter [Halothiobacillaceae bacterium]|nr:magnesium transporter [Halothiobacillaceae bacterium]
MIQTYNVAQLKELFNALEWEKITPEQLSEQFDTMHNQDIAEAMSDLSATQMARVIEMLPEKRRTEVFGFLDPIAQFGTIDQSDEAVARHILNTLRPDDMTALLESLEPEESQAVVRLLDPSRVKQALSLLGYPEESAGRLMTPNFIALKPDWSLSDALKHVQKYAASGETVVTLYITDERGRLLGWTSLRKLVLGDADDKVESLITDDTISIMVSEDREEAARLIQHYDLTALPVVDNTGVLLGMVTIDDVMDVVEEETTEDFHKLGGVGTMYTSVRDASIFELFKKRIGWLLILVFIAIFAAGAIAQFEDTLEAVVVLAFFLPLIIDSGGNAGSQGATMMVRALATGDVNPKDWAKLWTKELGVASALGLVMGAAAWGIGLYYGGTELANVVFLSMIAVVIFGSMVGMLLPFLLNRFKLDPATASAPLITSIADIGGILIYFSIAAALIDVSAAA